jgi:threonine 3-dehydrogenase
MKAAVRAAGRAGIALTRVPMPPVGERDVLIEVKAASICGSDVAICECRLASGTGKPGLVLGHEFCGVVAECGECVDGVGVGDFVVAEGHITCGRCALCRSGQAHLCPSTELIGLHRPGAFAEFVSIPSQNAMSVTGLPPALGAMLDPFACAVHAATAVPMASSTVLVTGCGPIGLMTIVLARLSGARKIIATEVSPYRMRLAVTMGADLVLDARHSDVVAGVLAEIKPDPGVDVFLEMSGNSQAFTQGLRTLRPGGDAVLLGLAKDTVRLDTARWLVSKGITMHGITGRTVFRDWIQARRFLDPAYSSVPIDLAPLVTHHFLLDDLVAAMRIARSRMCGKIMIHMDRDSMEASRADPLTWVSASA